MIESREIVTEKKPERKLKFLGVLCKCYTQLLEWKDWMCDPDGPTYTKVIYDLIKRVIGVIFILFGIYLLFFTFLPDIFTVEIIQLLAVNDIRYIGAASLFVGSIFYILGKYRNRVEHQTAVYNEDIDQLVSEVASRMMYMPDEDLKAEAHKQIDILNRFKRKPSEVSQLRMMPLRKLIVETYDDINRLNAVISSDLHDYRNLVTSDYHEYARYKNRLDKLTEEHECRADIEEKREKEIIAELQTLCKTLREEVSSEKFLSGVGEALFESITHWAIIAIPAMLLSGLIPLLGEPYLESELSFIHWGLLGMAGAALYTVAKMKQRDVSVVGEDEGNMVLRQMLLSMILGAVTAILFYMAIRGGWFGGKALPKLNPFIGDPDQGPIVTNVLSVIWAIAAGYSAKLLDKIVGTSENAS